MPNYVMEGEAIEGKQIFCTFEARPSYGSDKNSNQQTATITGNPATAVLKQVWVYKKAK